MNIQHIARAWRDDEFRAGLSAEALASLPDSPIGEIELNDDDLNEVLGGTSLSEVTIAVSVAVTVEWCISEVSGGTCAVQTQGCCERSPVSGVGN